MSRRPDRLLAVLSLPAILLLGGLGSALALIDPDAWKPELVGAVQDATGRTLTLGGPLRLQWSLWPTLSVTDARLANLPGGSRPDMARAERISARIALLPLLRRRLEIVQLTLTGPNILFEQVGDRPNWVFAPGRPAGTGQSPAGAAPHGAALGFRRVSVANGMLTFHFPARTKVIGVRSLDFSQPVAGGPLDLSSVLVYSDFQPFTLHASASPPGRGDAPAPDRPQAAWQASLSVKAFDATASARGTIDLVGGYDLRLEAAIPALEALNALLPQMRLPALHGLTLSSRIGNGPARGDVPVVGATTLHVAGADLGDRVPGLTLGGLDLSLPRPGGLATVSAALAYRGRPLRLAGTVGVPATPDSPSRIPLDLRLTADAGGTGADRGALSGTLSETALAFTGLDGTATLQATALTAWRPMLSPWLPALTDLVLEGRVAVPGAADSVALHDLSLRSAEAAATGDLRLGGGKRPALSGSLQASRLDLDALLPARPAGAVPAGLAGPLFADTRLPWPALRGPTLDLAVSADSVSYRHIAWAGLGVAATLRDGRLRLERLHLTPPGGAPMQASLGIDAGASPARIDLSLEAPAIPLSLLAGLGGLPGHAEGSLVLDTRLQASGDSPHALAASLVGPFSLTLSGGSIADAALVQLAGSALTQLRVTVPPAGTATIRCFGLVGSFTDGVGRFPTIALETGYLDLDGHGEVDLGRETLDLKLQPLARLSGARVAVPVLVDGPLRDAHARLAASGLDKLGLLIDAWFGGDPPKACARAGL